MDKYLSVPMPSKTQRSKSERRLHDAKMGATPGTQTEVYRSDSPTPTDMVQVPTSEACSGPTSSPEVPVTYSDVVRAVQDVMRPLMEVHSAKVQQAVQDMKAQLTQLATTVATNECRLGESFQDISDLKSRYETLQNPISNCATKWTT